LPAQLQHGTATARVIAACTPNAIVLFQGAQTSFPSRP
jgi:hypothetical protein